jgi:MFS family permease
MLDASIVTVAVAPIARQLHAPLTLVGWAVSGYMLALGVGLAATSWLAAGSAPCPSTPPAWPRSRRPPPVAPRRRMPCC